MLGRSPTTDALNRLRDRAESANAALAEAIEAAARCHDSLSYRLSRTRWRGIYRLEGLYVVPYEDHLGIDRQREFAEARHARDFRFALKIARDAKFLYGDPAGFSDFARQQSRDDGYPTLGGGGAV